MEFEVNTVMDRKSMTAMAKAARKTMRRKRSLLIRAVGAAAIAMAVFLGIVRCGAGDPHWWIDLVLAVVLLVIILTEDSINGAFAVRQINPDNVEITTTFTEEGYTNVTSIAEGHWTYNKIQVLCEMKDYFVFIMGRQQGQIYDKTGFVQGNVDAFRRFISEQTGKPIQYIK